MADVPPGLETGKLSSSADPKEIRQNQSAPTIAQTMSSHRSRPICLLVACASLISLGAFASVTYHFDWYCSSCATIGMGSNGREGPFASVAACEGARNTLNASVNARGCDGLCFNPQPCVSVGQPDAPVPASRAPLPAKALSNFAPTAPAFDPLAGRERRADEIKSTKEDGAQPMRDVSGRWRNAFSWYELRLSKNAAKDAVEIVLVETCRTPQCARKDYPNRPVFRGRFDGSRLVGVVTISNSFASVQNGRQCSTPAGEFPVEGSVSAGRNTIVWKHVQLPVGDGCAPASISLGTWRRG